MPITLPNVNTGVPVGWVSCFVKAEWYGVKIILHMRSNQYPTNKFEVLHLTNPLTPRSDKHVTSPYNIYTLSSKQVVRLLKLISGTRYYLD